MSQRGSVRKRGETFTAYWFTSDAEGKRIQRSKGGFRRQKDARAHLTEVLHAVGQGRYVEPSKVTLARFLNDSWLPAIRTTIRPSTFRSYTGHVEAYVAPRIGGIPLQHVNAAVINAFYADLLTTGRRKTGEGLSPATVRRVHATLHRALRDAVRWKLLIVNPADNADPPKQRQAGSAEMATWSADEVERFLAHVEGDRLAAAWVLATTTGLRRGELLGLRWADVDLDAGRASIRQTLLAVADKLSFSTPKTNRGRRSIPLPRRTVVALKAHRRCQLEERLAWGEGWTDSGLVFTRENGTPVHPDLFSRAFERHARRAGLPRIRLHDLRHTWATLGLRAGVQVKVVSEALGHSTSSFTADVYQHSVPSMQEDAAELIADLIFKDRSGDR